MLKNEPVLKKIGLFAQCELVPSRQEKGKVLKNVAFFKKVLTH